MHFVYINKNKFDKFFLLDKVIEITKSPCPRKIKCVSLALKNNIVNKPAPC